MGRGVQHFPLAFSVSGNGTVASLSDTNFNPSGSFVTLRAIPTSAHKFNGWTGDVESPSKDTTQVFIDGDKIVTANFSPITNVVSTTLPEQFALHSNFPNPFNPSTKISFELPKSVIVSLKIFNVLGQEVAELLNEKRNAGKYEEVFNASKLGSGVYFYRLQAERFTDVKKMLIIK